MAAYDALVSLAQTTNLNRYHTQHKYLFPAEARGSMRSIHDYVVCLQSYLENFPDHASRWEGRIRDLAHQTENFIEDFMSLQVQTLDEGIALPDLEHQLKDVAEKIGLLAGEVMEDRPAVLPASSSSAASSRLAPSAEAAVVGLEDNVINIRGRLCGEPSSLEVIPIVGMGGIGKTTLAKTVYNHASILDYFEFRAWITVSQDYSTRHSLRKILLGLVESMNLLKELVLEGCEDLYERLEEIDMCEIETKVFQSLKSRRYLIVMDDVWRTEVWDDLMRIFPDDKNGSRIILTTRLLDVASYPNPNSPLHKMQVMNSAQSWELLKQKVFTNGNCPPQLEDIGEEIADRCAGLPLTVVLVAGLLSAVNNTRASWGEIARNVNRVVGSELSEILSLSYTHLPHHLRPCFLYLGGFPEDEKIRAATLTKLWVAEGFVRHQDEAKKSLEEEEAEEYLEDLVKRNLVIVNSRKSTNGKIKSCSLHDMVRALCIKKAHEEKFLRVMDGRVDSHEVIGERRLSVMLSDIDSLSAPTTRTIISFNLKTLPNLSNFFKRFRLLRVLHDASMSDKILSYQVLEMFHLRYLALSGLLTFESAIPNLVNLQTLIARRSFWLKKSYPLHDSPIPISPIFHLPLEIWRMQQLRHLILHRCMLPHPPYELDLPLENLQTLSGIGNLVWSKKLVKMVPNVQKLVLLYESNQDYHLHHLHHLSRLEKLQVILKSDSFWEKCQKPIFPTTLKKLNLVGGKLRWAAMSSIASLPNLQVLKLRDHACYGEMWETYDDQFPQLKYLVIDESDIKQWIMHSTSFPTLERLVLRSCRHLEKIPEEIGEISTLELIETDVFLMESAMKLKEDQESYGNDALQVRSVQ